VYRLPDGRSLTRPSTTSDWRSSRKSLSELRRLLDARRMTSDTPDIGVAEEIEKCQPQARMVSPNAGPHEVGDIIIPPLSPAPRRMAQNPIATRRRFECIDDLLLALDEVDLNWLLDPCGRVRVLMKIASQFAEVEALPVLFLFGDRAGNSGPLRRPPGSNGRPELQSSGSEVDLQTTKGRVGKDWMSISTYPRPY